MDNSPYQPATPASLSSGSPYGYDDYRPTLDARPPSPASSRDPNLEYNTPMYDDAPYQPPKGRTRGPIRKHTKKKLDGSEKKRICQYHLDHQNARQEDIAEMFGIERSTVSKILKLKAHWLNVDDECATIDKRRRVALFVLS
jgi:DNA-binding NtrC family response regulator